MNQEIENVRASDLQVGDLVTSTWALITEIEDLGGSLRIEWEDGFISHYDYMHLFERRIMSDTPIYDEIVKKEAKEVPKKEKKK